MKVTINLNVIFSLFLIASSSTCFSQSDFNLFKSNFEELSFPIIINSYSESKEIPEEMLLEFLVDLPDEDVPKHREYYYQGRFENESYTGLIINRFSTSGAAGSHQNDIILLTYSPDGEVMAHFTLGTFWYNSDMGKMIDHSNELIIVIYTDGRIRTKSINKHGSLDGSDVIVEDSSNVGHLMKMELDDAGRIVPGVFKHNLATIEEQSIQHPLYTVLNEDILKEYKLLYANSPETFEKKREFLKEYLDLEDPLVNYKYAQTHDLYQYDFGDSTDTELALKYYHKSADWNYTVAHGQLYYVYCNKGIMGDEVDSEIALHHLQKQIETGQGKKKAKALFELAGLYEPEVANVKFNPEFPQIEFSIDSTIAILNRAVKADSTYNRPYDYLGSIYNKKGDREMAIEYYLKTTNLSSHTQVGTWLSTGDDVEQDLARGLSILHDTADKVAALEFYQGGYNPIWVLNELHYCSKLISKEELGEHDMGYFHCNNE